MNQTDKLAVLMPVFNGGDLLLESLRSCASSGLPGDEYEIIIVDNCSTDGSVDRLPEFDGAGAHIHVFRNLMNIGRVGNWNRAIELALDLKFQYLTFLFVGDRWSDGAAIRNLVASVRSSRASIGFAPFVVIGCDGTAKRESRRFYVNGDVAVCSAQQFLTGLLESGMFPLGPLQANVYRVDAERRPFFDANEPTRTDVQATLDFVGVSRLPVVITSTPFFEWREHSGRFHMSMGAAKTIEDYMKTFQAACTATRLPIHHRRAKARVILNSVRLIVKDAPLRQWPALAAVVARCAFQTPHRFSFFHFVQTLWLRFALGRRLLQFG